MYRFHLIFEKQFYLLKFYSHLGYAQRVYENSIFFLELISIQEVQVHELPKSYELTSFQVLQFIKVLAFFGAILIYVTNELIMQSCFIHLFYYFFRFLVLYF